MTQEIVSGVITQLSFGGEGILRHEGYVLFVPFTAVGDHVRVRIIEKKSRFGRAVLEEIEKPAAMRQVPRCPYFGSCGGCQLQHLSAEQQLHYKVQWLQDAFTRIGHLPWTLNPRAFPATQEWFYRRHIRLTLKASSEMDKGYQLGYQGAQPGAFVPIQECALFLHQDDPLFIRLEQLLKELPHAGQIAQQGSLSLMKLGEERLFCHYSFPHALSQKARAHLLQNWQCDGRLVGVALETPNGREEQGETIGSFTLDGLEIRYSPYAFVQTHPTQSAVLYEQITSVLQRLQPRTMLDLYCGIGVTSLLSARSGARTVGVEGNPQAILCANENRARNKITGVEFLCADVADVCKQQLRALSPDLVLVNPPRTGLNPQLRNALLKTPPRALLYISCMPPTMARDLAPFAEQGFVPTDCAVVDLFPQTTHLETLLLLERAKP